MKRIFATIAVLFLGITGLAACATDAPSSSLSEAPVAEATQESASPDAGDSGEPAAAATAMPDGARPARSEFPFPVPADWPELTPFTEEKIGKNIGMSAVYGFPEDATSAAESYRQLLEKAGFTVHPHPLGEQVHAASFVAEGSIDGVGYSGTLNFDTDVEGTHRVVINLTRD